MKIHTLHYYMHNGPTALRLELAGELSHQAVSRLDQEWRTASLVAGDRTLHVDITFLTSIDALGSALLDRWHREGARIMANSNASRALAESIPEKSRFFRHLRSAER